MSTPPRSPLPARRQKQKLSLNLAMAFILRQTNLCYNYNHKEIIIKMYGYKEIQILF